MTRQSCMSRVCQMYSEADSDTSTQDKTGHQDALVPVLVGWSSRYLVGRSNSGVMI